MAELVNIPANAGATRKSHGKSCTTTVDKQVVAFETKIAKAKAAHARLGDVAVQAIADAKKAWSGLPNLRKYVRNVEWELQVVNDKLTRTQRYFAESAGATEKTLSQLSEVSKRAKFLDREVSSLELLVRNDPSWATT